MHQPYNALLACVIAVLFFKADLSGQDVSKQYINLGTFKLTLGMLKDDLFREMETLYWFVNVTPATEISVTPGYQLFFVYRKTDVSREDLLSKSYPVGELAFQGSSLVLAMRFWLGQDPREKVVDVLSQAFISVSAGSTDCKINPPIPPGAFPNVKIRSMRGQIPTRV